MSNEPSSQRRPDSQGELPRSTTALRRHALLMGIDPYPGFYPKGQLKGCVNDAHLMQQTLISTCGFSEDDITLLTNEAATREGILRALGDLASRVQEDDLVVVYYAGHGSQMTDREGDEPDGKDSTLVPYDSGRGRVEGYPNRDISDDEIYLWLLKVTAQTPYVTLVIDACQSGTITRDDFAVDSRWVEPDLRNVEEMPASPVLEEMQAWMQEVQDQTDQDKGGSGWTMPVRGRYVLMAACRDAESANEYVVPDSPNRHGAFTFFFCQALAQMPAGSTYRDLFERFSPKITSIYGQQHPQMEGALDRELFGIRDLQPMRFVPVAERTNGTVKLRAGAAHGLRKGAEWTIYAPGTKAVDDDTPVLGTVRLTQVHGVHAEAEVLTEATAGAITTGTRAVETAAAPEDTRMTVAIRADGEAATTLQQAVEASPLLLLHGAEDGEAEACAYQVAPRTQATATDPAPQLGPLTTETWAVVGKDGRLLMPAHPSSKEGVTKLLTENLEKLTRYRSALALENPDPNNPLQNHVEMQLLCRKQGQWVEALPDPTSGEVVFHESDPIAIRLINRSDRPVYCNVLDFGLAGGVGLLHPYEGANEALSPATDAGPTVFEVGTRAGDELEVGFPEVFPFVRDPNDPAGAANEGLETFKLFATTHEADFRPLVQKSVRDVNAPPMQGENTPLGQLLTLRLSGNGTRDVRRQRTPQPNEHWTTVQRSFLVRR